MGSLLLVLLLAFAIGGGAAVWRFLGAAVALAVGCVVFFVVALSLAGPP